jgi:hypothetical protein
MSPIKTEVVINHRENNIYIIKETEKAILLCYNKVYFKRLDTEITVWCPKSIWENEANFEKDIDGVQWFKMPYFLIKN